MSHGVFTFLSCAIMFNPSGFVSAEQAPFFLGNQQDPSAEVTSLALPVSTCLAFRVTEAHKIPLFPNFSCL